MKVYIAPQIGSGTPPDPYRSKLHEYIDVHVGETFDEIDNPARMYSICIVTASLSPSVSPSVSPSISPSESPYG